MFRTIRAVAAASLLVSVALGAQAQDAAKDKSAKPAAAAKPAAKPAAAKPGAVVGRDWTKIDTNKDNYISPDEMEVWLKANGPDSK